MKPRLHTAWLCLMALCVTGYADDAEKKSEDKPKTIAELTENHTRIDGLITIFQDDKTGSIKLLLDDSVIDKELIYFAQAGDGVVQTGYFRGAYLSNKVISMRRHFDRIEVVAPNTRFYFDPNNALAKAADANISDAILATEKILAEDKETGAVLISGDGLFVSEAMLQIKPSPNPDADPKAFKLGSLSDAKSKILNLRSYPQNTDFEVQYVYGDGAPVGATGADVTDARSVSMRIYHSLIAMPDNDYAPRFDDPRVGYFTVNVTDLTSASATPYRDMINRWHLQKQDPSVAVSDPVEPITFWIENTTPLEIRDMIRSAALEWNKSFEKAGFRNAIAIKVQPDDADWDAGDIRYNVLRWTSSPNPPFGGYGPSFVNPRTGQILGADIMLEYSFLHRFAFARHLVSQPATLLASPMPDDLLAAEFCSLADGLRAETAVGHALMTAAGEGQPALEEQLVHDALYYLILHEIGHTLGLNHNMKATQLVSIEQAFDKSLLNGNVLAGSVMDYPAVNYVPGERAQTLFYTTEPGPYDDWAITFGYSPDLDDLAARNALLSRSTEPALAFGNDADDMRAPGKAIDPLVNIYDMSDDAIGYASIRMQQIVDAFARLPTELPDAGQSYQQTHDTFVQLVRSWARSAAVVSRYVGGVHLNRAMIGQPGAEPPYTVVDGVTQRRAMQVLAEQVFAPGITDSANGIFRYLAQQRRGFNFFTVTEDPKIHDAVLGVQSSVLDHLLHPAVTRRLTDTALYGNDYALAEAMEDLTAAIFAADARGNVDTIRQNLQINFVNRLAAMTQASSGYDTVTQSMAIYSLQEIGDLIGRKRGANTSTKAHVAHLEILIERALDADG
ncbi:MAG: zinc-dependent metalloprotease [Pseudomonadota bacterium]